MGFVLSADVQVEVVDGHILQGHPLTQGHQAAHPVFKAEGGM